MKIFMRSILIGVCILLGYSLVEASDQVSDTITAEGCYKPGAQIKSGIVKSAFSAMRQSDSSAIFENTKYKIDKIEYNNFRLEFTGQDINGKKTCSSFDSAIGVATDNLRNQFINCTITYTRIISFNDVDLTDYDSESAIPEDDLWGDKKEKDGYPKFELKSERKWHTVMRIKKALSSNAEFTIEGYPCLVNGKTTLSVPDEFKDMDINWMSIDSNDILSNTMAPKIRVTRKNAKILETTVSCTVLDGCKNVKRDSVKLLPDQTPISDLMCDSCLSTASKSIRVKATNVLPHVDFLWNGKPLKSIKEDDFSQTVGYPVPGSDDFTIVLTTSGGCHPSQTSKIVHRELADNVSLQVLDSCPTTGIPFKIATNPQLPNMDLNWRVPNGYSVLTPNNRKDIATITKPSGFGQTIKVEVRNAECGGSISDYVSISEAYTEMVAKDEGGNILPNGGSVDAGTKITFIAPQHSSITGIFPYTWSSTVWGASGSGGISLPLAKQWKGSAETTITAPSAGSSIIVTVSYVSCRGEESESYTIYSR